MWNCRYDKLACALRKVAAEHSDNPMYFVFPARRSSSRAPMDSSKGVSLVAELAYCIWPRKNITFCVCLIRTGVDSV